MSLHRRAAAVPIPCPLCCLTFTKTVHLDRHVQSSHKTERRCAAASEASSVLTCALSRASLADIVAAFGTPLLDAVGRASAGVFANVGLAQCASPIAEGAVVDGIGVAPVDDSSNDESANIGA